MKKKKIQVIILVATFSLIGIIITQMFWVGNAYKQQKTQFNSSTRIALKSVVNQLMVSKNDSILASMNDPSMPCFTQPISIIDVVDRGVLDSLIQEEFGCMLINRDYVYGVFQLENDKFVMGPFEDYTMELKESEHSVSLSCLCRADPYSLAVYFPKQRSIVMGTIILWFVLTVVFLLILIGAYIFTILSLFRQKRLSQMKTDFVNNMTHEFKTPISTISLASEMLLKPMVYESSSKTKRYANIIFDENLRLKNQVEQVLKIALIDKGDFKLKRRILDVHKVLENVVKSFKLIMKERKGRIKVDLKAKEHMLLADRVHFTNIINNLIDNANKYSPEKPEISITTKNLNGGILICVEDHGIGISSENQKHIFKKLFRVSTGNIHDVKGFGLGLYYVKSMVEAHGGSVHLKSDLNKGSRFDVYFPFNYTNDNMNDDEDE